jgi:hypothetical protein
VSIRDLENVFIKKRENRIKVGAGKKYEEEKKS